MFKNSDDEISKIELSSFNKEAYYISAFTADMEVEDTYEYGQTTFSGFTSEENLGGWSNFTKAIKNGRLVRDDSFANWAGNDSIFEGIYWPDGKYLFGGDSEAVTLRGIGLRDYHGLDIFATIVKSGDTFPIIMQIAEPNDYRLLDTARKNQLYGMISATSATVKSFSASVVEELSNVGGVGMSDPNSPSGTGEVFNFYTGNSATGAYSHAEGYRTIAKGDYSHTEGGVTSAYRMYSHAEGYRTIANENYSHAEGSRTIANGVCSHAEGFATSAIGDYNHTEGRNTIAKRDTSHAEGSGTTAIGTASHAEGCATSAIGNISHAEGFGTIADGIYSHAEGYCTTAYGSYSHAEGFRTIASGGNSHAEGMSTNAFGFYSHVQNIFTTASAQCETAIGRYNNTNLNKNYIASNIAFSVGNGTSTSNRGNAFTVQFDGTVKGDKSYSTPAADYAEMFEWVDGNPDGEDRVGYFVTLKGKKIKKATSTDKYIVGVVSSVPGVIGDNPLRWHKKYSNDEWGRPIYEEVEVPYEEPVENEDGSIGITRVYRTEVHRKLNPDWNGEEPYHDRMDRKEWAPVGLLGKLLVRQDGTLVNDSFCVVNDEGIATYSNDSGYFVMDVINDKQALILVK